MLYHTQQLSGVRLLSLHSPLSRGDLRFTWLVSLESCTLRFSYSVILELLDGVLIGFLLSYFQAFYIYLYLKRNRKVESDCAVGEGLNLSLR